MKIRTRLLIAYLLIVGVGLYEFTESVIDDFRLRYQATMEETMVDMSTVLASLVEYQMTSPTIGADGLRAAFSAANKKKLSATIYELTKTDINTHVYVTDAQGIVLFDSNTATNEGKDFSRWNDVNRTLRGDYGVRTTRSDRNDPMTATLFVAAPVRYDGKIAGVLTVSKPANSIGLFLETARRDIVVAGIIAAIFMVVLGVAFSYWITWPIEKLTNYAQAIREGRRIPPPKPPKSEIGTLTTAFEEMRTALEGKQYVEEYVQSLTHQMKSPLSAIRGAAELLQEEMPPDQRAKFLKNLRSESDRIQDLIDRMLQLSEIENRRELRDVEEIDLTSLLRETIDQLNPLQSASQITIAFKPSEKAVIRGERFLVHQAVSNVLQNAIDFSDIGETIDVDLQMLGNSVAIVVSDRGPGIPDYAIDKTFDRFYSLPHPKTQKKSSGLGLAFVREVVTLHGGIATLENRQGGGAVATLIFPGQRRR